MPYADETDPPTPGPALPRDPGGTPAHRTKRGRARSSERSDPRRPAPRAGERAHDRPVLDHEGRPLAPDALFLREAPLYVGRVESASTTGRRSQRPLLARLARRSPRLLAECVPIIALALAGGWLVGLWSPWLFVATAVLCVLHIHAGLQQRIVSTWVGTSGFALCERVDRWRKGRCRTDGMRFSDADALYAEASGHCHASPPGDGARGEQPFRVGLRWVDRYGRTVYELQRRIGGRAEGLDPAFVTAVDVGWSRYRLQKERERWRAGGGVEFPIRGAGGEVLRVSSLGLAVRLGDRQVALYPREFLQGVSVSQGVIHIALGDGQSLDFAYGQVGNARAFLALLQRMVSVSVEP